MQPSDLRALKELPKIVYGCAASNGHAFYVVKRGKLVLHGIKDVMSKPLGVFPKRVTVTIDF